MEVVLCLSVCLSVCFSCLFLCGDAVKCGITEKQNNHIQFAHLVCRSREC